MDIRIPGRPRGILGASRRLPQILAGFAVAAAKAERHVLVGVFADNDIRAGGRSHGPRLRLIGPPGSEALR